MKVTVALLYALAKFHPYLLSYRFKSPLNGRANSELAETFLFLFLLKRDCKQTEQELKKESRS